MTESTGLPEVREGEFWRVRHPKKYSEFSLYYSTPPDTSRLSVVLMRTLPPAALAPRKKHWPWSRPLPEKQPIPQEVLLYVEEARGAHPIAIVNAANRIIKRRKQDEARSALLGDYPPNRLSLEEATRDE